jgi:hypothetical protein
LIDDLIDEESDESDDIQFGFQQESECRSNKNGHDGTARSVIQSFVFFVLQLREEFFLPKHTMNAISNYIITLIESLQALLQRQANDGAPNDLPLHSTTHKACRKVIALEVVDSVIGDVCQQLQRITKNEYQFVHHCRELIGYEPPVEIPITNANSNEGYETAYFIPIERTLSRMLSNDYILSRMMQNIDQNKRSTARDDELMFSFRDGHFGNRIDDDSFLVQLYLDDIGVTNPIGAKKDNHKLAMFYFSLEDVPDQYRSKLDFIQLVAICESKVLKVQPHRARVTEQLCTVRPRISSS